MINPLLFCAFWREYRNSVRQNGVLSLSARLWRKSMRTYIRKMQLT